MLLKIKLHFNTKLVMLAEIIQPPFCLCTYLCIFKRKQCTALFLPTEKSYI